MASQQSRKFKFYVFLQWHPTMTCEENTKQLAATGKTENLGIPFDNDLIKCCPMCSVPIEKDEGCAQMMCKRCKHVFCWYCLASLDVSLAFFCCLVKRKMKFTKNSQLKNRTKINQTLMNVKR